jgi:hypothetical protein
MTSFKAASLLTLLIVAVNSMPPPQSFENRNSFCPTSKKSIEVKDLALNFTADTHRSEVDMIEIKRNIKEASEIYEKYLPSKYIVEQKISVEECNCDQKVSENLGEAFSCVQKYTEITISIKDQITQKYLYPSYCAMEPLNI